MKIVIADPLPSSAVALLLAEGWIVDADTTRSPEALAAALADADAVIVRSATQVDAALLAQAPNLKVVGRAGTGVDNVDLDAASARGILVVNAPGANSVSVAEHTFALLLASARAIATADAQMKAGRWEKKRLTGTELRGKTLGIVGLGRIGREVVHRGRAFGMRAVAYDPYIATQVAADLDVELLELDELCARADFITLHVPSAGDRPLFDAARLARCKPTARIINTARGTLIDETALADAIVRGALAGAGLDVFETEPPADSALTRLPEVVATPHIAGSTMEAQELVGLETATCVRDYLKSGVVQNAVNYPSLAPVELNRLQPYTLLARRLGAFLGQVATTRTETIAIRYYGDLAEGNNEMLVGATLVGFFGTVLSTHVTPINARSLAKERGIEIIESRSSRPRNFTSLISVKLHTCDGDRWVEGAVFEQAGPRLLLFDGVTVEAPLDGKLVVIHNSDQPGVIGDVGTLLGRHGINIATFALGRSAQGAVAIVKIDCADDAADGDGQITPEVLAEIRAVPAVQQVAVVTL
ncbi:MAG: phosphoglycerate dehydrogenase [Acidobacteria bacterium]|nr:phosphoglycerate dehydrogenase [Acidobacteriota bacterium]